MAMESPTEVEAKDVDWDRDTGTDTSAAKVGLGGFMEGKRNQTLL